CLIILYSRKPETTTNFPTWKIIVMSTLCYMLARFVSGILDFGLAVINSVDIKQFHGAEVGLASLVTTYILMQPLQGAYRAYSKKQIWCISFTGGIVSSLLML